jgi:hypothetical protein
MFFDMLYNRIPPSSVSLGDDHGPQFASARGPFSVFVSEFLQGLLARASLA